jgi:hypothetical protein
MAIKPYQALATPVGHFDILDIDSASIKGGEVLVFDRVDGNQVEYASPDVLPNDGYRAQVRLAGPLDIGPFFLAANEDRPSGSVGFENTNLYSVNTSYAQTLDSSGKASLFSENGFYAVSSDVVDTSTITRSTPVYTKLYAGANGYLTATPSISDECVAYFIEYQRQSDLRKKPGSLYYAGTHTSGDTVIIYKRNGHPTVDTNYDGYLDGYIYAEQVRLANSYDGLNSQNLEQAVEQIVGLVKSPTYDLLNVPYAAQVAIDFSLSNYQFIDVSGPLELVSSNLSALRTVTLFLESSSLQPLTLPLDWRWIGSVAPTQLDANKILALTLISRSTSDSGVIAMASVEA